ncbi:MAG: DUF1890 domain-containing protein [Methanophagales archaeon ANME-1-THS]|nr:MAG: DUF1890 domain-containing protein [Methanophagales archaeon ANME-1-THS]
MKLALLLLGCPEVPVQTGVALYLASGLKNAGMAVYAAGTDSALDLLKISDPKGCYLDPEKLIGLDTCIEALAEKRMDFDLCSVFVHNDAGLSYLATIQSLSTAKLYAIIFGKDAEALAAQIEFTCEKLAARAVHNPAPLKRMIDATIKEVERWAASN